MLLRPLATCLLCLAPLLALESCSSGSDGGSSPAGGSGGSIVPHDASVDQTATDSSVQETGTDVVEEPAPTTCPEWSWGNVPNTKCDMIEQQCANGLTCYPNVLGGKPGTSCTFIGNGLKVRGQPCEDSTECAQGLACLMKYCTPFCCPQLQYEICGPGGLCDVLLQISPEYHVRICSYAAPCTLWQHDCPPDEACQLQGTDGSTACTPPASGSFVGEGEHCTAKNDCGDSQACVGSGALAVCRYLCKLGATPFDAGVQGGEPGAGGCPEGQTCQSMQDAPSWLGVCSP